MAAAEARVPFLLAGEPVPDLETAVGRGSGEAFQLKATGQGTVNVQASEQKF